MDKRMSVARNVPTQVRVQLNNKIIIPLIDGYLSLKTLKKYYPQASGITYSINGETVAVQFIDEDRIIINESISTYDVYIPNTCLQSNISIAKKHRLDNMLEDIGCGKKMLQSRSTAKKVKNSDSIESDKFKRRVANISWKHRKSINEKFKCLMDLGYKMKMDLNLNEDYSVTELKNKIVGAYLKPSIKYFFYTSRIELGYGNDEIIRRFTDDNGTSCTFWEFSPKMRDKGHRLNIYILTTAYHEDALKSLENLSTYIGEHSSLASSFPEIAASREVMDTDNKKKENYVEAADVPDLKSSSLKKKLSSKCTITSEVTVMNHPSPSSLLKKDLQKNVDVSRFSDNHRNEKQTKTCKTEASPSFSVITTLKSSSSKKESHFSISDYPSCSSIVKRDLHQNEEFRAPLPVPIKRAIDMNSKLNKNIEQQLDVHLPDINECDIKFSNVILGSGGQGIVRKATWAGTTVAVKTIKKLSSVKLTLREIKMLEKVRHSNFINIMALSRAATEYHIVLEFFDGRSLQNIIFDKQEYFQLDSLKKNSIALQLCNAISFIHSQKNPILHRDVKPGNVMVNKNCIVKVCDLGLSKSDDLESNLLTTMDGIVRGTIMFMAPELLLSREKPTVKSDVWAVACTLVELYNNKNVWNVNYWSVHEDVKRYLQDKKIPDVEGFPTFIKNSIKKCFDYDINKRLSMIEMSEKYIKAKEVVPHRFFDF